jgi:T5SS/PEP-CTERM-associated repeat protein
MRKLVLVLVLVTGVAAAHAAPLTIDAGNEDYFVTTNETVDEIRVGNVTNENRLYVQSGATLTTTANNRLYLGYGATSANNLVNVDGIGSSIDTTGDWTFVGLYGVENTLLIENGGTVNSYGGHVGYYPLSIGNDVQVEDSGSRWTLLIEHLYVGRDGDSNSVTISAGGTVAIEGDGKGLRIGVQAVADNNRVTVTGSGSVLSLNNAILVGQSGTNSSLTVAAGGSVTNGGAGFLGYLAGSSGTGTVAGAGSQWNNANSLYIGGNASAAGGSGTLNLNDSGLVTVSGTTRLWSTGTIDLDGGNLTTGSFDNSDSGTLNFYDGTLTVNGAGGVFNPGTGDFNIDGNAATDLPELVIAGTASAALSGNLNAGVNRQGKLTVEAGSVVSNTVGYIGRDSGSTGIATITGSGSRWNNSGSLLVGREGSGTLNVEAGGRVTNTSGYIGNLSGSTGMATITGSGSRWNNSSGLVVGDDGNGTLNVEAAGWVTSANSYIGRSVGSMGTATVTGTHSRWDDSQNLNVGFLGNGTLNIEDGGVVSNNIGYIGRYSSSTSVATVTGSGSKWQMKLWPISAVSGILYVGYEGDATLNVEAGGVVSNINGRIGNYSSSTSVATVTGSGSKWTNSGSLWLGYEGDGTLNVEAGGEVSSKDLYLGGDAGAWHGSGTLNLNDGGLVTVEYDTKLWSTSTLNLNGGSLTTRSFDNSQLGTLNFYDGTLTVTGWGSFNPGTTDFTLEGNTATDLPELVVANMATATLPGDLTVGVNQQGKLSVEAYGVVSNTYGQIGYELGSTGVATVAGAGSQWNNSKALSVGVRGNGTLNVEAGGVVTNTDGYIARDGNSEGVVTISGSDSTWINSGDLHVGKSGSGSMNITDNGEVQVGGMTWLYANGTVNIDGGTMSVVETLQLDAGSTVNLNSGTLSLIGFSGDGNLAWNGGTLELTGPAGLTVGASGLFGSLLTIDAVQTLNVINTTTIQSGARIIALGGFASDLLKIESGGQFDAPSGFTNQDEIQLSGADARITGSVLTNDGFISGDGRINALLINTGQVNISGGTILFGSQVTNNAGGFIGGRDVFFRFDGGLTNNGEIGLSVGVHDILGSIDNTINGRIMVAGQSTATFYGDMTNDGDIFTGQGSQSVFLGDVTGSGNFPGTGTVEFAGAVSPGSSPGAVHFGGDVLLGSSAEVEIELLGTTAGSGHDQLAIAGTVNLDGTLDLLPLAPYTDPVTHGTSDEFVLITAGARNGTFNTIQYDGSPLVADFATDGNGSFRSHAGGGLFRSVTYTAATVQLQNLLALAGDTDGDRDIDLGDYTRLATNFAPGGRGFAWTDGDFDSDGDIDLGDYNSLASNFAPGGYGPAAVPEPAAALLALLGMLLTCLSGNRSTHHSCR